jgi:hypothetical protein
MWTLVALFPLNKVHDELGNFKASNGNKAVRIFDSFFSYRGDFDDKLCDPFEEDRDQGGLTQNGGSFLPSDFWFV